MPSSDRAEIEALYREYLELAHAMQSGVAMMMNYEPEGETTHKSLRTGVNSSMVDASALAHLLIKKGVITELEYATAIRDGMRTEVERYTDRVREATGARPDQTIILR